MDLVLRNDTLCASEFAFDQLDADQPFTVMTIGGVVGRGESRVVTVRFEPKPVERQTFYSVELRLTFFKGTSTILLRGTATNDMRYSTAKAYL